MNTDAQADATKTNVLVIDDNVFNLDIILEYIEDDGYEATCCEHAIAGWNYLESHVGEIDVILLDRMMPHMDGMTFFEKLRHDDRFKNIPVIMISAMADPRSITEGEEAGVFGYIAKPFERDVLLDMLRQACSNLKKAS